jgi:hypothetical protein
MPFNLVMATVALAVECGACAVFNPTVQVGPNFRVKVTDRSRPIKGLRLEIGNKQAITDKDGFAVFRDMLTGLYSVRADRDGGMLNGVNVDIKRDGPADVAVPLKWPATAPILVRSLKGTIHSPAYLPGQPQPTLLLDLLEGISGRHLESTRSTGVGEFGFMNVAPGLYFLRVNPSGLKGWSGEQIQGLIAVNVDSTAQADQLDLDLGWTSCGLTYTDRNRCSPGDLQVAQLCGQTLDSSGAVISDAHILLFDLNENPKLIERMQSDRRGNFDSPKSLDGTYQLFIRAAGFTALRTTVHVQPNGSPTCRQPLKVHLGVLGTCSAANIE